MDLSENSVTLEMNSLDYSRDDLENFLISNTLSFYDCSCSLEPALKTCETAPTESPE